jgi:hypothetical protein
MVQVVSGFEKGSPNYKTIFPDSRKPFGTGGKTARVNAVSALATAMAAYPALAGVEALVSAFATQIGTARDLQEGAKGTTKGASLDVESKRIVAMTGQYQNLGFLINKLAATPEQIAPFFDLNVLRESSQVHFTGTLDPGEAERVLVHTFAADDELLLEVTAAPGTPGGTAIRLYLATTPGGTDSSPVAVEANAAPITISAAQFGILDYAAHRYLTAVNSTAIEVHYTIELE